MSEPPQTEVDRRLELGRHGPSDRAEHRDPGISDQYELRQLLGDLSYWVEG